MLRFSDGMKLDISGEYRISQKSDGLYVLGGGMSIPCSNIREAEETLHRLQKNNSNSEEKE